MSKWLLYITKVVVILGKFVKQLREEDNKLIVKWTYPELVFIYLCLQIKVFVSLMYHSISHGKYVCPIFSQDKS